MPRLTLLLFLSLPLLADPPSLESLIADLGSDRAATREKASSALADQPAETLPTLRTALEGDPGKDPEVAARLQSAIRSIERAARRAEIWKRPPEDELNKRLEGNVCTCGNKTPWKSYELDHEILQDRMPECRLYVLDWTCCQRKPVTSHIFAVCRNPDSVIELGAFTELPKLAARFPSAKTAEDAAVAGGIAGGLMQLMKWEGPFEFELVEGTVKGDEEKGFVFEMTETVRFVFGVDGKLAALGLGPRR